MFILYDIIFIIFAILYVPYVIIRKKWHSGFKMRFGALPEYLKQALSGKQNIWIHAVSVGEVLAVKRLVHELQQAHADKQIVISTVTTTGNELARKHFPEACVIFAPLDFSFSVRAYIRVIKPVIYIAAETEIWPNIFYALDRQQVPIIQVNGRISDKSYPGYKRGSCILKHILAHVKCFCMQTQRDADRIIDIGADSERVKVVGNMKFDDLGQGTVRSYGQIFDLDHGPVLVAGSTHFGEEEIILNIFKDLCQQFSDLSLIIAPRHVERADQVATLISQEGLLYTRFSDIVEHQKKAKQIILVDTIGHLKNLYAYASVVFVGKSLVGRGGQNIIEPVSFGRPVIVGPHTENFQAIVELFSKEKVVIIVKDQDELYHAVLHLLDHPNRALEMGMVGKKLIETQQGAVAKTLDKIQPFLS